MNNEYKKVEQIKKVCIINFLYWIQCNVDDKKDEKAIKYIESVDE